MPEQPCTRPQNSGSRSPAHINLVDRTWPILFRMGEERPERATDVFFRAPRRSLTTPQHRGPTRRREASSEDL